MNRGVLLVVALILLVPVLLSAQDEKPAEAGSTAVEAETTPVGQTLTVEAIICRAVEERQPMGRGDQFEATVGNIFLWNKIIGATDSTAVTHVWSYEGREVASVELPVKSALWRTWSSKKIPTEWSGLWEVRVIGSDGVVMATVRFTIGESAKMEEADSP